ncbi:site-specific DNA-methyltransferase [Bacteroides fragilis]|uniref:DNA-methyltransferase n=1 Tax=Bacteroides fragilis TaxID=817 RepID=UPI002204BF98|nr:site-specific DNA-methyltransferase [Bacteroides fragilis]UVP66118.1 site-specific DNA-methyltransferase [Bacteroides fragilis]UVQ15891.1 site-specific DNA-methyltransferase [Bacteroides fragilis]
MSLINNIVVGDCSEVLRQINDESIDMCITSPPYDNLRVYKGYKFPFERIVDELFRVLKKGGVVVWVVSDATINGSETGTSFKQALAFISKGFNLHDTMIFKKTNPVPQIYRKRYTNEFEYMFVFSKGAVTTHNPLKVPCLHAGLELKGTTYKNFSTSTQKRGKLANPVKNEKLKGNIWEYVVGKKAVDQEAKNHPAPFPYDLAKDHILSWTNEGDIVLDPMCGSGTSIVAAYDLKRKYIGIDISEEYCQIARDRLQIHKEQQGLFANMEEE